MAPADSELDQFLKGLPTKLLKPRRSQLAASSKKRQCNRDILSVNQRLNGINVDDDSDYVPEEQPTSKRLFAQESKIAGRKMTARQAEIQNDLDTSETLEAEGME